MSPARYLLQPIVEPIGTNAEIVDGKNLVVDVDARLGRGAVPADLAHHQAAGVVAGRHPEPGQRAGGGRAEAETEGLQGFAVVEFRGPLNRSFPESLSGSSPRSPRPHRGNPPGYSPACPQSADTRSA